MQEYNLTPIDPCFPRKLDSLTSSFTPLCAPNLRLAGTSFQRKEGSIHSKRSTFSPLPLEGTAWRSETGVASPVCWKCVSPVSLSPPLSDIALYKKATRSGARGLSLAVICAKTFFHLHHPLSYRQCPIRPFGAPSPKGEGWRYENSVF